VGCGLRRGEAVALAIGDIQQRDGRWVIVDLRGKHGRIPPGGVSGVPAVVLAAGKKAGVRFIEFFTANIRNPNTRRAYSCRRISRGRR